MGEKLKLILWILIIAMNVLAFVLMGVDKWKTKAGKRRIPEKTLFLFAVLFGALGGSFGMYSFRHKTKHWYFAVFFPLLAVMQLAAIVYLNFFA